MLRTSRFKLVRLVASVASLALVWACNTPYIPVPPAMAPNFMAITIADAMGPRTVYEAHGEPFGLASNAKFFIFNDTLGIGVIAKAQADGSYVAPPLDGKPGDAVDIFYQTPKGEISPPICRKLSEGVPTEACD